MSSRNGRLKIVVPVLFGLALAGCVAEGVPPPEDVTEAASDDATGSDAGSGPVGFDELERAVIQIEATGTFEVPGEGAFESAGRGSGFIIEPSGLAVTNNHVVTGAGTLAVWLDGQERNAQVLGVSECLDLAVIQVEGENLPFLDWRAGDIANALEVWAAGFPLGDPEFTITRGIVSKNDTAGASTWASLDHIIEHDARIRSGNSGGPLVDAEGRLVGVNYAGDDALDFNFAIHRDEVLRVLEDLKTGTDVLSLGINGQAWVSEDGGASGIFAASVDPGSPAGTAGLEPGDLLTSLQGVSLAVEGTMEEYCSVLRTHGPDATLDVAAYRPSDDTLYEGQFNGEVLEPQLVPTADDGGGEATEREYVTVHDDADVVTVNVPADWSVNGASYTDSLGNLFYDVAASPDVAAFFDGWEVSGVQVGASSDALDDYTPDSYLDEQDQIIAQHCSEQSGHQPYDDGAYQGVFDVAVECGSSGASYWRIAAVAVDGSHFIRVNVQLLADDEDVLDTVVATFIAQTP